jgi:hypothetical protein
MEVRTAVALQTRFQLFAGGLDVAWAFAVDIIRAVAVRVHLAKKLNPRAAGLTQTCKGRDLSKHNAKLFRNAGQGFWPAAS